MSALPNVVVINGIHADIYKEMPLQQDRIGYFDTLSYEPHNPYNLLL